jgi:hypothetical protein
MDNQELVGKVIELLQREKRVSYRVLKRRFDLDDDYIDDLKIDLIEAKRLAIDGMPPPWPWHISSLLGNHAAATTHLSTACAWFKKLQVPIWVERTEHLAQEYGVTLAEVALEELTERET